MKSITFGAMRTLGSYVIHRRQELGLLKQVDLANASGIPDTTINRIEKGTTKLPSADVRRKLARALVVSHLDLLIAAGEINEDELCGATGIVTVDPADPRQRLHAAIDSTPMTDDRIEGLIVAPNCGPSSGTAKPGSIAFTRIANRATSIWAAFAGARRRLKRNSLRPPLNWRKPRPCRRSARCGRRRRNSAAMRR